MRVAGRIGRLAGAPAPDAGAHVLELLRSACGFSAANLVRWNSSLGCHTGAGNDGYDDEIDHYLVEQFPSTVSFDRVMDRRLPVRVDDEPFDFRDSEMFHRHLAPRGFDDGITTALFTEDDQYAGLLHMSSERRRHFDNDLRDYIHAISFLVAGIVVATAPEAVRPTVNWRDGDEPPMTIVRAAEHFAAGPHTSWRTLWHHEGAWQQVAFSRNSSSDERVDVDARPEPIPYGLTRRELQIATTLASGLTNREISTRLGISPRTVGKHVERVLAKLGCASRSHAAVCCIDEGVIDLDLVATGALAVPRTDRATGGRTYVT